MKEVMKTVEMRSTIFIQQNFGYTPETAKEFGELLLPEAKVCGIPQPGIPILGINPTMPQYGMSWRLFKKMGDEGEYNIAFQPGKIDIILSKEALYISDVESSFCNKSTELFNKILLKFGNLRVQRIAYAPLYAIGKGENSGALDLWQVLLRKTVINGMQAQDVNLQFVLKQLINFDGIEIQMNLLHRIFDGIQTKTNGEQATVSEVLLFQLDLNSIPEKILNLGSEEVGKFFSGILNVKNNLIENVEA